MGVAKKLYNRLLGNNRRENTKILKEWEDKGKPAPPPHLVKQKIITAIRKIHKQHTFIETGTFHGDMVEAQKKNFKKIYSIELSEYLFTEAVKRFERDKKVTILNGDSGDALIDLMPNIYEPAIFWLDGHYSGGYTAKGKKECPIYEELTAIFNSANLSHILLIDDARLFIGVNDYPTILQLTAFIKAHRPYANIYIVNDIIHAII